MGNFNQFLTLKNSSISSLHSCKQMSKNKILKYFFFFPGLEQGQLPKNAYLSWLGGSFGILMSWVRFFVGVNFRKKILGCPTPKPTSRVSKFQGEKTPHLSYTKVGSHGLHWHCGQVLFVFLRAGTVFLTVHASWQLEWLI